MARRVRITASRCFIAGMEFSIVEIETCNATNKISVAAHGIRLTEISLRIAKGAFRATRQQARVAQNRVRVMRQRIRMMRSEFRTMRARSLVMFQRKRRAAACCLVMCRRFRTEQEEFFAMRESTGSVGRWARVSQ